MDYFSIVQKNKLLTHSHLDEPQQHNGKLKKPDTKDYILCMVKFIGTF